MVSLQFRFFLHSDVISVEFRTFQHVVKRTFGFETWHSVLERSEIDLYAIRSIVRAYRAQACPLKLR